MGGRGRPPLQARDIVICIITRLSRFFIKRSLKHRNFHDFEEKGEDLQCASAKEAAKDAHKVRVGARDDHFSASFESADDLFCRFFCRWGKFVDQIRTLVRGKQLGRCHSGAYGGNEKRLAVFKRKAFGEGKQRGFARGLGGCAGQSRPSGGACHVHDRAVLGLEQNGQEKCAHLDVRVKIQIHHAAQLVRLFGYKTGKFGQNSRVIDENIGFHAVFCDKIKDPFAVILFRDVADKGQEILAKLLLDRLELFFSARKSNDAASVFYAKKF